MKQRTIGAIIGTLFIVLPLCASAQTDTSALTTQAQALLQQIAQLQAQLGGAGGTNSSTATGQGSGGSCPTIGRILKYGSSGADVFSLQTFLSLDPAVYPEGKVTGYFGQATQAAVKRWQVKYNVVSSGSPSTTGFGMVGPRTISAMSSFCTQSVNQQGTSQVDGYIQVTPITGTTPLAVTIQAFVNTLGNCNPFTYTLDFGDGTPLQQIPTNGSCTQITQTYQHTYIYGGTYQITLSA